MFSSNQGSQRQGQQLSPPGCSCSGILVENSPHSSSPAPGEGRAQTSTGLGEACSVFEQLKGFNENQGKEF